MDNITSQLSRLAYEVYNNKPLFDVRVDQLPEIKMKQCELDSEPIDCKAATKCTQKSGYYTIYLLGNKAKQIMVFCDMEIAGGNWMHILRRIDGSENFTRPWSDYVNGFGNVEKEYWIGLENLNAFTNNNGRQQLYVHLWNPTGESNYASYNNFLVGNATETYKLKSLGEYYGTGGDGIRHNLDNEFRTFDNDNVKWEGGNSGSKYGGWWHNERTYSEPTGNYYTSGITWYNRNISKYYSYKIVYFMIRSV
ncbi:ficolin-1-like [Calliphora vicina]|uniref:ficolin-1-like n=1 Tax=Calliphora vicina TaxID=7373 RepID=UPI00325AE95D